MNNFGAFTFEPKTKEISSGTVTLAEPEGGWGRHPWLLADLLNLSEVPEKVSNVVRFNVGVSQGYPRTSTYFGNLAVTATLSNGTKLELCLPDHLNTILSFGAQNFTAFAALNQQPSV